MPDRALVRLGGAAAISGAVLAVVFNLLHPRPTAEGDPVRELLRAVAGSDGWVLIHLGILLASLLIIVGLFVLARTIKGTPGENLSRLALGSLLISGPVAVVTFVVDGYATKAVADAWASASGTQQAAALGAGTAVAEVGWAMFMGSIITFLGGTPAIFGAAIVASRAYPAMLGWVAIVFGLVSVVAGAWGMLDGPSDGFLMVFTVSSLVLTLFVLVAGVFLVRRASEWSAARVAV
jgi:hypothetical protein